MYSRRGLDEKTLSKTAFEQGRRLEIHRALPGAQAEEELNALLLALEPERVFITPLFTFDVALTAARFPGVLFISEQPEASGPLRDNLVRIVYKREEAFEKAGEAAARLIAGPGPAGAAAVPGAGAGILSVPLSERGRRELAAFRAGFAGRAAEGILVERLVDPISDRTQARRALEEMRQAGVMLILFKTYSLTTFCLEELKKQGGWAIIEDYEGNLGYEDVVLLSIEDDLTAALAASWSASISPPVLEGETYLRWSGPDSARGLRKELGFVRD